MPASRRARSGLLVGVSAGGGVAAALEVAEREHAAGREAVIVTILCDSAEKYMSERFWQEGMRQDALPEGQSNG